MLFKGCKIMSSLITGEGFMGNCRQECLILNLTQVEAWETQRGILMLVNLLTGM